MSSLRGHSILPSGAFDNSAFAEDLSPILEQSEYFGRANILLAPDDCESSQFPRVRESILQKSLSPLRFVTLDEFSLSDQLVGQISKYNQLAVIIDREPSAAAIERMVSTGHQLEWLSYVVIGRKDWRFKDTFRSLPHFLRPRVFLDFPVSLHSSDPFYSPAELTAILDELRLNCGPEGIRSFSPHFHLRRELLSANVIAVSAPTNSVGPAPEISIVVSEPALVNQLAARGWFEKFGERIELVISRVSGHETAPIDSVPAQVSHLWLHLEDSSGYYPEIQAHLRNWGAQHARGKLILFADGESAERLSAVLERLWEPGHNAKDILRSGLAILVEAQSFRAAGGYDPLYFRLGLGDPEFLYRYLGGMDPEGEDADLAKFLRDRIRGSHSGIGLGLIYHQYFDVSFLRYFLSNSSGEASVAESEGESSRLRSQFRYRMEQSRDAYLSIYQASPRVALDGNIQLLLKPYHWVRPHAWRLKMPFHQLKLRAWWLKQPIAWPYHQIKPYLWWLKVPVYALVVKPFHQLKLRAWWLKQPIAWPYHQIKPYAWRMKMPLYRLAMCAYHKLAMGAYHSAKRHAWRIKAAVVMPYHFLRMHAWRLKQGLGYVRGNLWRVKQVYYFLFWFFFPVRKIYYVCEYQFEKRILGLYGRQQ